MRNLLARLGWRLPRVYWLTAPRYASAGWLLFPLRPRRLGCGIAGILDLHQPHPIGGAPLVPAIDAVVAAGQSLATLDGSEALDRLEAAVNALRSGAPFAALASDALAREAAREGCGRLTRWLDEQAAQAAQAADQQASAAQEAANRALNRLRDARWTLERDVLLLVDQVRELAGGQLSADAPRRVRELHKLVAIFESLDRLEIRGRDSLGVSLLATFEAGQWDALQAALAERFAGEALAERCAERHGDRELALRPPAEGRSGTLLLSWRTAAEIGHLGDNVKALRAAAQADPALQALLAVEWSTLTSTAHTRWASNGIINLANCHPIDNVSLAAGQTGTASGVIQVVLNGDIDNYEALRREWEQATGREIEPEVTTDAKIISLAIERHLADTDDVAEAFRRAVASFAGSAAIAMHTDLAPGKVFLSLRGSGQALYIGLLPDGGYTYASEVYGIVALTDRYLSLDGETPSDPARPDSIGQLAVIDAAGPGGVEGVRLLTHGGQPLEVGEGSVKRAQITTRDIDREDFRHYFLKEVGQAPGSVNKTLRGKFALADGQARFNLGEEIVPPALLERLRAGELTRILCVGQGTAGVAAAAIACFTGEVLRGRGIAIQALRASELSGFELRPSMAHVLVIAVTQSGTTTDTNRAIEMVRERGAATLAIVNRRDSAITEKVDGVFYTSDGRDVEMSVASTKAFYSQVTAGAVLALRLADAAGTLPGPQIARQLAALRRLPALMEEVLAAVETIAATAREHAPRHRHWAVVGSGPNLVAANEVRIKLSELCYKSIACDVVEDKKHIDLSSEPLILVLAAGNPESVLGDLVKDVAIFKAHKATPIVVASEMADDFAPYASALIRVPAGGGDIEALVLNTVVGHLFGYHAATAIDASAEPLIRARAALVSALDRTGDAWEALTEAPVREALEQVKQEVLGGLRAQRYDAALGAAAAVQLATELSLIGQQPADPALACEQLLAALTVGIDQLARPIDAIKHQAKTVTVGTSRRQSLPDGPLFRCADALGLTREAFHVHDVAELKRLQPAITGVPDAIHYRVSGLAPGGLPDDGTLIEPRARTGDDTTPSRTEGGVPISGTKRMIARTRQVFIGSGAADGRPLLLLPTYDRQEQLDGILLCHLTFAEDLSRKAKTRALGVRYEELKHAVIEANHRWDDAMLDQVTPARLFTTRPDELAKQLTGRGE